MSPMTRRLLLRSLSLAGPLTALTLVATPTVHGQDGARVLLNQVSAPAPRLSQTSATAPGFAARVLPSVPVNGERALLGYFGAGLIPKAPQLEPLALDTLARKVDGAQALLGRPATTEARRRSVANNQ